MSNTLFSSLHLNDHGVPEVAPEEVWEKRENLVLIDVRRQDEFTGQLSHIEKAKLSTLELSFSKDLLSWDKTAHYVFICRSGFRSSQAVAQALSQGFKSVYNLEGGMILWNEKQLPTDQDPKSP